jgi:hypothetical protein
MEGMIQSCDELIMEMAKEWTQPHGRERQR